MRAESSKHSLLSVDMGVCLWPFPCLWG